MEEERIRQYKSGTAVEIKTDGCGGQEEKMNRNELTKKVGGTGEEGGRGRNGGNPMRSSGNLKRYLEFICRVLSISRFSSLK